ncbi:hypothetical protein Tco_1308906, partial [Tanacetum coccineum]
VMSSASSAVTYTFVYTNSEPGRPVAPPSLDYIPGPEEPQTPPIPQDEDEREPMFIQPHDPDYVPEPMYPEYIPLEDEHLDPEEYEDDETEDGPVDYPMAGGEDGDDDDGDLHGDNANDKDEDKEDEDEEDEEEEHLALADSAIVVPTVELVSPPKGTEPASISLPPKAEVERLLAMPTPPPSRLISLSPPTAGEHFARCMDPSAHSSPPPVPSPLLPSSECPTQIQTLRIASTQALVDAVSAALPSPPLPPLPPSLYILPPIDRRDDIPKSERPPRKRSCLFALGPKYEVGESSTARPTGGRRVDYGFVSTLDAEERRRRIREVGYGIMDTWVDPKEVVPEIAPMTVEEVNTRVTELAELHEHDTQDLYNLLEDAQDNEEAYAFRESWTNSVGLSQAVHYKLQTHHEQMQQTEMAELRETNRRRKAHMVEILRVMRDMRREMGDMQVELLALRIMAPVTRRGPNTPPNNTNPNNMTPESVQAMIDQALLRNSTNGDGSHSSHGDNRRNVQTTRPCFYADFMKCQPLNFKGNEGVVGLTRWIEKMESVFNISGCAIENQVKFATCTLLGAALTWWNGQIRTLGPDAYSMTWEVLKKKMTDKKLEIELWNLKVKGNDVPTYTECFQELTLICTKFIANETEKVDKYISGLPDNIYGNVKSSKPKTLDETIELVNDLMDQKLRTYAERQTDNKRKADDSSRNNHGHQ